MLRAVAIASIPVTAHPVLVWPRCVQMCPTISLVVHPDIVDSMSWCLGSRVAHTELYGLQPLRQHV